jgi:CBS domain-containing protein
VTRADSFLGLYEQLDEAMRTRLRADRTVSHARLIEMMAEVDPTFRDNASRLQAYRALRNALVHHPRFGVPELVADPRPDVVEDYARMVAYVLRPPTALETIAVRKVYTVGWQTPVLEALRYLLSRSFRLAPILAEGSLDGIFTETTLAQVAAEKGGLHLTDETTFEELRSVTSLDVLTPTFRFLPAAASVVDAEHAFAEAFRASVVLSALLITEGDRARAPLLGIITAHDLPSVQRLK